MYCIKCGQKIKDDAEYCMYCGAPQYEDDYEPEHHFPFGILLIAVLTISAFLLFVFFPDELKPKLNNIKVPSVITDVLDDVKEKTGIGNPHKAENIDDSASPDENADASDSIVGAYKAVSAVVDGESIEGPLLMLANISFKVNSDGTFSARIKGNSYSGSWYKDEEYVEFYTDTYYFTGSFTDEVLSLSDDSTGMAVVLEKK